MKQAIEGARDDTGFRAVGAHLGCQVAFHCVCFTCPGLTVSEDGTVVTGHDFFKDRTDDILIYHALVSLGTKDLIKVVTLLTCGRLLHEVRRGGDGRRGRDLRRFDGDVDLLAPRTGCCKDARCCAFGLVRSLASNTHDDLDIGFAGIGAFPV